MKNIFLTSLIALSVSILQSNAQISKPIGIGLLTSPLQISNNAYNASLQLQSRYAQNFTLNVGGSYNFNNYTQLPFDVQMQSTAIFAEIRFFPYGQRNISFKKPSYRNEICSGKYGCLRQFGFKKPSLKEDILRGLYIAPGFEKQETFLNYIPHKELEAPKDEYTFNIIKNAFSLAAGYQVQVVGLTLGVGYKAAISKPKVTGDPAILNDKDFINNTHPLNIRFEQSLRIEIGINF
jgi:hypothetical protein